MIPIIAASSGNRNRELRQVHHPSHAGANMKKPGELGRLTL